MIGSVAKKAVSALCASSSKLAYLRSLLCEEVSDANETQIESEKGYFSGILRNNEGKGSSSKTLSRAASKSKSSKKSYKLDAPVSSDAHTTLTSTSPLPTNDHNFTV